MILTQPSLPVDPAFASTIVNVEVWLWWHLDCILLATRTPANFSLDELWVEGGGPGQAEAGNQAVQQDKDGDPSGWGHARSSCHTELWHRITLANELFSVSLKFDSWRCSEWNCDDLHFASLRILCTVTGQPGELLQEELVAYDCLSYLLVLSQIPNPPLFCLFCDTMFCFVHKCCWWWTAPLIFCFPRQAGWSAENSIELQQPFLHCVFFSMFPQNKLFPVCVS